MLLMGINNVHAQSSYCSASTSNGCTGNWPYYVEGITLSNLSRSGTGCSGGYEHYTAQTANLNKGATYTLTIKASYPSSAHNFGIWIDFDNDTTFATSSPEWLGSKSTPNAGDTLTYIFTVPTSASIGNTRMRIRVSDFQGSVSASDQCGGNPSSFGYGEVEDYNLNIQPAVSCNPPYDLHATNVTGDSVTLSWNSGNTGSQSWDVEYGPEGFSPGTGTMVNSTTTTELITGLAPNQSYDFYVQEHCTASDSSVATGPVTFCGTYAASFTTDVESTSPPYLPDCWHQFSNLPVLPTTVSGQAKSGTNSIQLDNDNNTGPGLELMVISPKLRDLQSNQRVRFYARLENPNTENLVVGTMADPSNSASFDSVQAISLTSSYQQYFVNLLNTPANHDYVAFKHGNNVDEPILIDNITYEPTPSCLEPTNLQVSDIDSNSATINWQSGPNGQSWTIQYDTSGFPLGSGLMDTSLSTTKTITGLNSATNYDFYIKEVCSSGDSSAWIGPVDSTTSCASFMAPLTEGFEAAPLDSNPLCWDTIVDVASGNPLLVTSDVITPHTGSNYYLLANSGANNPGDFMALISPKLSDLSSNNNRLRFYAKHRSGGNYGDLIIVGTLSDKNNQSTFTGIDTFSSTSTYQEYIAYFDNVSSNAEYFAIKHGATNSDGRLFVDDIVYEPIPTCPDPANFQTTNIDPFTATIDWTAYQSGSTWNLEYGVAGFSSGNGTLVNLSNSSYTISNLDYGTDYDVYVKEFCANGDTSNLVGPLTFTTDCITESIPYFENFSDTLPACWAPFNNTSTLTTCGANNSNTLQISGAGGAIETVEMDARNINELLVTYQYRKGSPNCGESFDDANDSLRIEHWNGSQWVTNVTYGAGSTPTTFTWDSLTVPAGNQDFKLRFSHVNSINSPGDGNWNIDSFSVKLDTSGCIAPVTVSAGNVSNNTASINWTPLVTGTQGWKIQWGPSGFSPGSGDSTITAQKPYALTGLNSNTSYDVYVANICSSGDTSSYSNPLTFTTECDVNGTPYTENFEQSTWTPGPNGNNDNAGNTIGNCWTRDPHPSETNNYDVFHWGPQSNGTQTGSTGPDFDHTTGNGDFIYTEGSNYNSGDTAYITSPSIDLSSLSNPTAGFWYHMHGNDVGTLMLQVSNDGGNTWNTEFSLTGEQQNENETPWLQQVVDLSAYTNQTIMVRFAGANSGNNGDMAIDDLVIDDNLCAAPYNLAISNASDSTADVSWNANNPIGTTQGVKIQWGPAGFNLGQGDSLITTSSPQTINLSGNQGVHEVYISQICSSGDTSSYYGPVEFLPSYCYADFINGCNLVRIEDFTLATVSRSSTGCSPNAYSLYTADTIQLQKGVNYNITTASSRLNNAGMAAWIDYDNSKGFGQNNEYLGNGIASNNGLQFEINFTVPSNVNTGLTRLRIKGNFANPPSQDDSCSLQTWGEVEDYVLKINPAPSCIPPSNFTASSITMNSANINWTSNGSGNQWIVEWDTSGFTLGQGNRKAVTSSPSTTLSGLTSNTLYNVRIAEVCSPGDTSKFKGHTFTFRTDCQPSFSATYTQQWDYVTAPFPPNYVTNCWRTDGNQSSNITLNDNAGGTGQPTSLPNEVRFEGGNDLQNGDTALLVSPEFSDLTNYDKWIRFNAAFENGANANHKLYVGVMANQSNSSSFVVLDTIFSTTDGNYQEYKVYLDNASLIGNRDHVAFAPGSVNNDEIITIDDFTYENIPSCFRPSDLKVTAIGIDSAQIKWSSNDTGSKWQIEYSPLGYTPGNGTVVNGFNDTTGSITGLASGTTYDVYVREICAPGDTSAYSDRVQLTTGCASLPSPLTLPYNEGFETFSGAYLDSTQFCQVNGANWKFRSSIDIGRLQFADPNMTANTGNKAAVLDVSENINLASNDLVLTLNMTNYATSDSIFLSFYHRQYGEENHPNDSVWIRGSRADPWIGVYDLFANQLSSPPFYENVSFNISEVLANAGQSYSSSFQVKFGQEDNYALATDGRSFDDISISTGSDLGIAEIRSPVEQCNLTANEPVSVVIKNEGLGFIAPNTTFDASYQFNGNTQTESITLNNPLPPGDTMVKNFGTTVDLSQQGSSNSFSTWVTWSGDNASGNDTMNRSVDVPVIPQTPVVNADTVCEGNKTSLMATGNNHYRWYSSSSDSNLIATGNNLEVAVSSDTTFYVSGLTYQDSCESARVAVDVKVHPNPVANFTSDSACLNNALQFTDNSNINSGTINQYSWNFGDGNNGSGSTESHTYNNPGSYNVMLTVTSDEGCADSIARNATAHPMPVADFSSDSACLNNSVQFTENASVSIGSIDQYNWQL